jgi:hypothetical protein
MKNIDALAAKLQHQVDGTEPAKPTKNVWGNESQEVFIDPVSIAIMASILTNTVKLIAACREARAARKARKETAAEAATETLEVIHDPNIGHRRALKRAIREEVGGSYPLRKKYYDTIRQHGSQMTESDLEGLNNDCGIAYTTMEYDSSQDDIEGMGEGTQGYQA